MANLARPGWVHFVAIGGTGMGALAGLLKDQGWKVTGSDGPLYPPMSDFLSNKQIPITSEYSEKNLLGSTWGMENSYPDLVIVGNAISRNHVEAKGVEALVEQKKLKRMSFAEALAEFAIGSKRSFVVCGTHGKTTTTSVLAWMLEASGKSPGFFIGGIPTNFSQGARLGGNHCFVSEGDEYDTAYWDKESKFLHYRPSWVLCTGIEFDHADIFSTLEDIVKSFQKLTALTREGWLLIDDTSSPRPDAVRAVAQKLGEGKIRCLRYGFDKNSEYFLKRVEEVFLPWKKQVRGAKLVIQTPELSEIEIFTPLAGRHNALNLVGVIGVLLASGEVKSLDVLQKSLMGFLGVKRRQEEVVNKENLVVLDDFAHHPTAIRETIAAVRSRYPGFKIGAFFEARSATSARNVFEKEFSECFDGADAVFLSPPTKTNIPEDQKLNVQKLVDSLRQRNQKIPVFLGRTTEELKKYFREWTASQPLSLPIVALVMSNGPFGGIHGQLQREGAA